MPRKPYNWKDGPDFIQAHSIAKHRILQSYLAAYFQTLVSSPHQEQLRLTLVDGFAGGGLYVHSDTKQLVKGSPFIFLDSVREAEYIINTERKKPIRLDVDYFFVEAERNAYMHLDKVLRSNGYEDKIGNSIHLLHAKFQEKAETIIDFVRRKNPRNGRAIFALDQYGYSEVPFPLIRGIFSTLPKAEVILTFGVDSFLNYASDGDITKSLLEQVGVSDVLDGVSIEEIKSSGRKWRLFIQSKLYAGIVRQCGAAHFTPFFIRNKKGHGDYWLIHLSQHPKARDVMTEVHWNNNNYFIHYGGAGLNMFQMIGYDPDYDSNYKKQNMLGFEFDDEAKRLSLSELGKQIPSLVRKSVAGVSFQELFTSTCNHSPATESIYRESIGMLMREKVVEVIGREGARRQSPQRIKYDDQIIVPRQQQLFTP